jgi:beta propeller repeat protein
MILFLFFLFISYYLVSVSAITEISCQGTETRITTLTDTSVQVDPAISGDKIVWLDDRDCCQDNSECCEDFRFLHLYFYDITAGNETLIWYGIGDVGDPESASIAGDRIIWHEFNFTAFVYDIRIYDIITKQTDIVASEDEAPYPKISGNSIVWQAIDIISGNYSISQYDLNTKTTTQIALDIDGTYMPHPDISGLNVVWQEYNASSSTFEISVYDTANPGEPLKIATNISKAIEPRPKISGNTIVWQALNGSTTSNVDIFIYDIIAEDLPKLITSDLPFAPAAPPSPEISGNRIIWVERRTFRWIQEPKLQRMTLISENPPSR